METDDRADVLAAYVADANKVCQVEDAFDHERSSWSAMADWSKLLPLASLVLAGHGSGASILWPSRIGG